MRLNGLNLSVLQVWEGCVMNEDIMQINVYTFNPLCRRIRACEHFKGLLWLEKWVAMAVAMVTVVII